MSKFIGFSVWELQRQIALEKLRKTTMANKPLFNEDMLDDAIITFLHGYKSCCPDVLKEQLVENFKNEVAIRISELVNNGKLKVDMNFHLKLAQGKH